MQATQTTRRFDLGHIKQAALAIGIIGTLALGALTANALRDGATADSSGSAAAISRPGSQAGYQFLEQNLDLPSGTIAAHVTDAATMALLEQNVNLPSGTVVPAVVDAATMRFLEQNLYLPGPTSDGLPSPERFDQPVW